MTTKLRTALLFALFMLTNLAHAEQVTFDLSRYTSCKLFGFEAPSSKNSHQGDILEEKTAKIDEVSITVTPNPNEKYPNRMWTNSLRLFGGKLIIKAPKPIKEIDMKLNYDKWGEGNTANVGTLTKGHWEGNAETVEINIAKNTRFEQIVVKYGDITPPVDKTYTIHDLCQSTEDLTDVKIELKDAKVLYCFYTNAWIRQGNEAIMLYLTGIDYVTNDIINGTFRADFQNYKGTPEIKGNFMTTNADNLVIAHSTENPEPRAITFEDLQAKKYISDLVELKDMDVTVEEDFEGTIYSMVKNGEKIQLYNKLKLDMEAIENGKYTVKGIVTLHDGKAQLYPTKLTPSTTGINSLHATTESNQQPVWNLMGQRVGTGYKGIIIRNGKKVISRVR